MRNGNPFFIYLFTLLFLAETNTVLAQDPDRMDSIGTIEVDTYDEDDYEPDRDYYFVEKSDRSPQSPGVRRQIPRDKVEEMRESKSMWYVKAEPEAKDKPVLHDPDYVPIVRREWFQALLWILIIGSFVAFLFIYLTGNRVGLLRKTSKKIGEEDGGEELPENIFAIPYQARIDKAVAEKNYRLAVRLMFLQILKELADRGVLSYSQDKTNFDYLMQLHPTSYYPEFSRVTRVYEYCWYGKFEISEEGFDLVRKDFQQLNNRLQ